MKSSGRRASTLVIGGGVIGLTTALALRDAGHSVRLLERGRIGRQASWAGGGILSPLYPWRESPEVQRLAADSQRLYPSLAERLRRDTGIDPEWTPSGLLSLGLDAAEQAQARVWASEHCFDLQDDQDWRGRPALYLPEVAQIRNPRLCQALARMLLAQGVTIEEDCPVEQIERLSVGGYRLRCGDTSHTCDRVVLCAGVWSGELAVQTGWELPLSPVKGQMILLRGPAGLLGPVLLESGRYLIPRRDGRILVGSTVEDAGFDCSVDIRAREQLRAFALSLLPEATQLPVEAHWAGLRPAAPRGIPLIARHPVWPGFYVNAGQFRNGLTLAPASAQRLLALVAGDEALVGPG